VQKKGLFFVAGGQGLTLIGGNIQRCLILRVKNKLYGNKKDQIEEGSITL